MTREIITFIPIIIPIILLLGFKLNSSKTMSVTLLLLSVLSIIFLDLKLTEIYNWSLVALFKLITPIFILIGAMTLLNILEISGALNNIKHSFNRISPDQRIQVIIVSFLFEALIEGISGFGTPATIAAPILISLGFKPFHAIVIALLSNSFPVTFGATGFPIHFGVFETIEKNKQYIEILKKVHKSSNTIFNNVSHNLIFLNYIIIPIILTILMVLVTTIFIDKENRRKGAFIQTIPVIFLISILYPSIELIVFNIVGYSFVSIISPILMILIIFTLSKIKLYPIIPKIIFHKHYGDKNDITSHTTRHNIKLSLLQSWIPYLSVIILLLITRIIPWVHDLTTSIFISYKTSKLQLIYNPGFIFLIVSIFTIKYYKLNYKQSFRVIHQTSNKLKGTLYVLIPTFILIELFMSAKINGSTMSFIMSKNLSTIFKSNWIYISPFLGLIGSFINGSATVSNISFSLVHVNISSLYNIDIEKLLSLQVLGANVGNMICISNIIVVCSVVGVKDKESNILTYTIISSVLLILVSIVFITIFR